MKIKAKVIVLLVITAGVYANAAEVSASKSHKRRSNDTGQASKSWVRKGHAVLYKDGAADPSVDVSIQAKSWSQMISTPEYVATSLSDHLLDEVLNTPNYPTPVNHHATTDTRNAGVQNFGIRFMPTLSKNDAAINIVRFNFHYKPYAVAIVDVFPLDALTLKTVYAIASGNLAYQAASGAQSDVLEHTTFQAYQATSASSFSLSSPSVSFKNISLGGLSYTPNSFGNASDSYSPGDTTAPIQRSGHDPVGSTAHVELLVPIAGRVYTAICNTVASSAMAEADLRWGLSPSQPSQHDQWEGQRYENRLGDAFVFDNP